MSWVETESLSFTARHDSDDSSYAERTLDRLEHLRLRLEDRFELVPEGGTIVVHTHPLWPPAPHPFFPRPPPPPPGCRPPPPFPPPPAGRPPPPVAATSPAGRCRPSCTSSTTHTWNA